MVAFNFNVYGHDFERGLMILRDSLTAAMAALDQQRERISAEYDADYDLELIEETKNALRKTHAIAIYHHWERVIRSWTGAHGRETHDELAAKAIEKGQGVADRLKVFSHLNNTLKHNSQRFGPLLLEAWPEVFPKGFADFIKGRREEAAQRQANGLGNGEFWPDWFDAITLTDAHVDEVFVATRASGPRAHVP